MKCRLVIGPGGGVADSERRRMKTVQKAIIAADSAITIEPCVRTAVAKRDKHRVIATAVKITTGDFADLGRRETRARIDPTSNIPIALLSVFACAT